MIEHYKKLIHDLIDPDSKYQYEKSRGSLIWFINVTCPRCVHQYKHRDHKNLRLLEDFPNI